MGGGCIPACTGQRGVYPSMHWAGRGVYPSMHWAEGCVSQYALGRGGVSQHTLGRRGCLPRTSGWTPPWADAPRTDITRQPPPVFIRLHFLIWACRRSLVLRSVNSPVVGPGFPRWGAKYLARFLPKSARN